MLRMLSVFLVLGSAYGVGPGLGNMEKENFPNQADMVTPPSTPQKPGQVWSPHTPVSPSFLESPITKGEKRAFHQVRVYVAGERLQNNKNLPVMKAGMKASYQESFPRNYWKRKVTVSIPHGPGKLYQETVYQQDALFDPEMLVVRKVEGEYRWDTNVNWMAEGKSPISYHGRVEPGEKKDKEAYKIQRKYALELHHFLQDQGVHGLGEVTRQAHHSLNDRASFNPVMRTLEFYSSQAEAAQHGCVVLTDNLHLGQDSEIDRELFGKFREAYWKARATAIQEGVFEAKAKRVRRMGLFHDDEPQHIHNPLVDPHHEFQDLM